MRRPTIPPRRAHARPAQAALACLVAFAFVIGTGPLRDTIDYLAHSLPSQVGAKGASLGPDPRVTPRTGPLSGQSRVIDVEPGTYLLFRETEDNYRSITSYKLPALASFDVIPVSMTFDRAPTADDPLVRQVVKSGWRITTGPLFGQEILSGPGVVPASIGDTVMNWRIKVLVYRTLDAPAPLERAAGGRIVGMLSDADIRSADAVMRGWPGTIERWSGGRIAVELDITVVDPPLTEISLVPGFNGEYWPSPDRVGADARGDTPLIAGRYDAIIALWPGLVGLEGGPSGSEFSTADDADSLIKLETIGMAMGDPGYATDRVGYIAIRAPRSGVWNRHFPPDELFTHEFLHLALAFLGSQGTEVPELHDSGLYADRYVPMFGSGRTWYERLLRWIGDPHREPWIGPGDAPIRHDQ